MTQDIAKKSETYYEVGAVAKISGLSPHTIRTWERRDFIRAANRSATGRRQYNREQVDRLTLFKKLTNLGDSISALANLSMDELTSRLSEFHHVKPNVSANRALVIKVFTEKAGEKMSVLSERFSVIPAHRESATEESRKPDLLVLEVEGTDQAFQIQLNRATAEFPSVPLVLIYDFLQSERLKSLGRQGYFLIKRPIPQELLEQYLVTAAGHRQKVDPTNGGDGDAGLANERILSDRQLAAISASTPRVKCECPHHMSALVSSLSAFEDYCARCEVESPEDTILHAHLGKEVGKARFLVEKALVYLCESDQIDIPEGTS